MKKGCSKNSGVKRRRKRFIKKIVVLGTAIVFIILIFRYGYNFLIGNKDKTVTTSNIENARQIHKSNSISLEENEYFKKYTIKCEGTVKSIKQQNVGEDFNVTITDADINDVKNNENVNFKNMYLSKDKNNINVRIKKLYEKENYSYIDKKDENKVIILISKKENPYRYKVTIDPGHGGRDPGTGKDGVLEKDVSLKIVKYMVDKLKYNGCDVKLTRVDDNVKDSNNPKKRLKEIADIANEFNSDAFVSVHVNAGESQEYNGVSTYYYTKKGTYQNEERKKIAQNIQDEILKKDNWKNMKTIDNDFMVLRDTKMPSALVECGFVTNPEDRRKLKNNETLQNFADNISNGLIKYLKETKN